MGREAELPPRGEGNGQRWLRVLTFLPVLAGFALRAGAVQSPEPTLLRPSGAAYDAAGNLFLADADRNQVFEITLAGTLTVVAGTGVQGFAGDGGPANAAELNAPQGVAVAADGTIYIADTGNQRIRVVQDGRITTFAGGAAGFSGDGGPGSEATFNQPVAVALDMAGNVLICDRGNQRVRRVSGGVVTTIAGDGVEGFSGDGGPARAAELNEPSGIAAGADGRIFIADAANERIRVVTTDGKIATFAGTGTAGFSGDGRQAIAAQLNRPGGLAVDAAGELLIADQNNQRLREVGTDGTITTLAGSGVQGPTVDGAVAASSALNLPSAVTISGFGWPLITDPGNHMLRALLNDGRLYEPAGLTSRTTALSQASSDAVYGTALVTLTARSGAGTPQGIVQVLEDGTRLGQGALAGGAVSVALPMLSVGEHSLTGDYEGDGVHPSATSSSTITVSPAPVVASATSSTVVYGELLPPLTGTLSGTLAQDQGDVSAVFSAAVAQMPEVGSYPIAATLSGPASGNYSLSMDSSSGALTVVQAASVVTLSPVANAYAGLPLQLSAHVTSTTQGVPTGSVAFLDRGVEVASAALVNGSATAVYLAPSSGSHQLAASYSGDRDFTSGISSSAVARVMPMPDFGVSVTGSSQQVVVAGSTASYELKIASESDPFTGVVTLSASGLPAGATATFSPSAVVPGTGSAAVTMTIATAASTARLGPLGQGICCAAIGLLMLPLFARRRRRWLLSLVCLVVTVELVSMEGCGARSAPESTLPVHNFVVTIKATSTNLAGEVVVHSADVTLGVE